MHTQTIEVRAGSAERARGEHEAALGRLAAALRGEHELIERFERVRLRGLTVEEIDRAIEARFDAEAVGAEWWAR